MCVFDVKEVVICDFENFSFICLVFWKIGVNFVFFGWQLIIVCLVENGQIMCIGVLESFGIVKKLCDGLIKCDVYVFYD